VTRIVRLESHPLLAMIRHIASSIPPKLTLNERFGTLSLLLKRFLITDQRDGGAHVCCRISMWGQALYIDVDCRDVERGCVLVEYPLVGSIRIVQCYFADMGVQVLPIVQKGSCQGDDRLLGQASVPLLQIFDGLVAALAIQGGKSSAIESSSNIVIPLVSISSEKEACTSFHCYEFGEMHVEVKLQVHNKRVDSSALSFTNERKEETDSKQQPQRLGGTTSSAIYVNYSKSAKERRDDDDSMISFAVETNIITETSTPLAFDFDSNSDSLTSSTDDDSILLDAMLDNLSIDLSPHQESTSKSSVEINTKHLSSVINCTPEIGMGRKDQHRYQMYPSLPMHNRDYAISVSTIRFANLRIESIFLSSTTVQPLLCHIKEGRHRVQVRLECEAPLLAVLPLNQERVASIPLIAKHVCRQNGTQSSRGLITGWQRKQHEAEARRIESKLEGLYNISHASFLWNVQFHNDDDIKTWLLSSLRFRVYASIEKIRKGKGQFLPKSEAAPKQYSKKEDVHPMLTNRIKLGETQVNLGSLFSQQNCTMISKLEFGPLSNERSTMSIKLCLFPSLASAGDATCFKHTNVNAYPEMKNDTTSLDLVHDSIILEMSEHSHAASQIQEPKRLPSEHTHKVDAAGSYPLWVCLCLRKVHEYIVSLIQNIDFEENDLLLVLRAEHILNCSGKQETHTFLDETERFDRAAKVLTRTSMLTASKLGVDTGTSEIRILIRVMNKSDTENDSCTFIADILIPLQAAARTQISEELESIHYGTNDNVTAVIGSLYNSKRFAVKIHSATIIQTFWKCTRKKTNFQFQTTVKQKSAFISAPVSIKSSLIQIPLVEKEKEAFDSNTDEKLFYECNSSSQLMSRSQQVKDDHTLIPMQEIEISFGQCSGIREVLTLWADGTIGNDLDIPFSFHEESWVNSGFLVTFSLLARSKTNPASKAEMTYYACRIKRMQSVARHQVPLNDVFQVFIDDSGDVSKYLKSEMMLCKLWYVPLVTDTMISYHQLSVAEEVKIVPDISKLVCITKCPLYALLGTASKSYLCPWYLAQTNPAEALGKVQISLKPNGCKGHSSSAITLGLSQEKYSSVNNQHLFDWDLPDKIEANISRLKANVQTDTISAVEENQRNFGNEEKEEICVESPSNTLEDSNTSNDKENRRHLDNELLGQDKLKFISPEIDKSFRLTKNIEFPRQEFRAEHSADGNKANRTCHNNSFDFDNADTLTLPREKESQTVHHSTTIPPAKTMQKTNPDVKNNVHNDCKASHFCNYGITPRTKGQSVTDSELTLSPDTKSRQITRFDFGASSDAASDVDQACAFAQSKTIPPPKLYPSSDNSSVQTKKQMEIRLHDSPLLSSSSSSSSSSSVTSSASDSFTRFDAVPRAAFLRASILNGHNTHYYSTDDSSTESLSVHEKTSIWDKTRRSTRESDTIIDSDGSACSSDYSSFN